MLKKIGKIYRSKWIKSKIRKINPEFITKNKPELITKNNPEFITKNNPEFITSDYYLLTINKLIL